MEGDQGHRDGRGCNRWGKRWVLEGWEAGEIRENLKA